MEGGRGQIGDVDGKELPARFVAAIAGQSGIAIEGFRDPDVAEGWLQSAS